MKFGKRSRNAADSTSYDKKTRRFVRHPGAQIFKYRHQGSRQYRPGCQSASSLCGPAIGSRGQRKRIVADMEAPKAVEKSNRTRSRCPRADRSGVVIEPPGLTDQLVCFPPSRCRAGDCCRWKHGRIQFFVPKQYEKTVYFSLDGATFQDWCISRHALVGPPHSGPAMKTVGQVYAGRG